MAIPGKLDWAYPDTAPVAQTVCLLYRRLATCGSDKVQTPHPRPCPADCQSAIRQVANLRYEGVKPIRQPGAVTGCGKSDLRPQN